MKIIIKDQEYHLPDNMGEITIEEYMDIEKLKELYIKEELTDVEYVTEVASTLTGIHPDLIMSLEIQSFNDLYNEVYKLASEDFVELKKYGQEIEFEIDNVKYKFDTKLDNIPTGQWIDLDKQFREPDFWANAPKLFAMLLRPVDEKGVIINYNINEINSRVELFRKKLKLKYFLPVHTFFLTFSKELQK